MTHAEMKALAREVARETVEETLLKLGADHKNATELQKDFATIRSVRKLIEADRFYENLEAVEEWRHMQRTVRKAGTWAVVTTLTTGLLAMVWIGFKQEITSWFG